jgi:hypothetical protein
VPVGLGVQLAHPARLTGRPGADQRGGTATGHLGRIRRQLGRPVQRLGPVAGRRGLFGAQLQGGRDRFGGSRRGRRQVPGPGEGAGRQRGRETLVRLGPVEGRAGQVRGQPGQRIGEAHTVAGRLQQPGLDRPLENRPGHGCGGEHHRR